MEKAYEIKLDLYDSFIRSTSVNYISEDKGTMLLDIQLINCGEPVPLFDGDLVLLNFENPKGIRFVRSASIADYEQGRVLYEIQDGDIAVAGDVTVGVTIVRGEKRLSWHGFKFTVTEGLSARQTEPPSANAIRGLDFFTMDVNGNGYLTIVTNDIAPPPLWIDKEGCLIYTF